MLLSTATAAFFLTGNTTSSFTSAHEQEPIEIISLRSEYEKHFDNANAGIYTNYNPNIDDATVRFYTITKDTCIYNSCHGDGRDDESTGSPYCQ